MFSFFFQSWCVLWSLISLMLKLIQKIWPFNYFHCLSTQFQSKRIKILLTAAFKTHNELDFIKKKNVLFIREMCVHFQVPITFKRKPKQFLNEYLVLDWSHHNHMNESHAAISQQYLIDGLPLMQQWLWWKWINWNEINLDWISFCFTGETYMLSN